MSYCFFSMDHANRNCNLMQYGIISYHILVIHIDVHIYIYIYTFSPSLSIYI